MDVMNTIPQLIANRYRVESFLGKGGMAEVYKVWDMERNVHLAMKVLHADLAEDRVFLRRFKREAQTLATLQHPNIVRFYGLEQDDDLVFMLMDYVEGTTLRKEVFQAKAALSLERIQEVMRSVCAALYYAHKSGFVHCDVKPANIMIHSNGIVYVSDFGISRMTEASTATMVGAGTPAYMSPEQIKGDDPTPQMDIYALGIVLFEMLTGGERPFTGENAKTTGTTSEKVRWEQLRIAAPPPSSYNPAITPSMDAIVLKCLDKTPANRYLSAMDLYGDLVTMGNAPVQPKPVQSPVSKPPIRTPTSEQPQKTKNSRQFMGIGAIILGVLSVAMIIAGSAVSAYQKDMSATSTAQASNMLATATKQAENLFATATKQEKNDRATAASMAKQLQATPSPAPLPFYIYLYDETIDTDAECIICKVENLEYSKTPGHYYWSLDFPVEKPAIVSFGWCTLTQDILEENWKVTNYELIIDGYNIDLDSLELIETKENENYCFTHEGVLDGWGKGKHSYIWTHHISKNIFDGWDEYQAGDYIYEFTVNIK